MGDEPLGVFGSRVAGDATELAASGFFSEAASVLLSSASATEDRLGASVAGWDACEQKRLVRDPKLCSGRDPYAGFLLFRRLEQLTVAYLCEAGQARGTAGHCVEQSMQVQSDQ